MTSRELGKVFLVGAGPGDPGLITLRAVACLKQADVVFHDYLANEELLQFVPRQAQVTCLGKHGRTRIWTQAEVNRALIAAARQGQLVVRLKGGDPAIFAHLNDEVEALSAANIPFEIVPGITAALAASSYAGVSLTDRGHASAVALVTAHEDPAKLQSSLDYARLADFPGTLVFYMGVTTAPHWSRQLLDAGKPADTPCIIVRRCSFPDQQRFLTQLDQVAEKLSGMRPPIIVLVGGATTRRFGEPTWFEERPLFGQSVLVTRPSHQAGTLRERIAELGAEVLQAPAIEIEPPADWSDVDRQLQRLSDFHWVVFSSANGVSYFLDRLMHTGHDLRRLATCKLAAIGSATADALRRYHLVADCVPEEYRAESLAAALSPACAGQRFLLVRANRGRDVLPRELAAQGADVTQVVAYQHRDVPAGSAAVLQRLQAGTLDWVTLTSSAIARSAYQQYGAWLQRTRLASISPVTTQTIRELGLEVAAEAKTYTMEGLAECLVEAVRQDAPSR